MAPALRIGIDVGGTFTDLFLFDDQTGKTLHHKLASTPDDPYRAPIQGLLELLGKANRAPEEIGFIGLGTTVGTNALLERKGAVTGLITTAGFRDLLEIGRQNRPDVYDLFKTRPQPLVPRERRLEVAERMAADGTVITPLDQQEVDRAVEVLRQSGCQSLAICLLNAYANPSHEQAIAGIIRQRRPEVALTVSQELLPEFREYERLSSTVVNASLMPVMKQYLDRFSAEVRRLGVPETPFIMSSGGGVFTPALAGERPIDTLFSGPSGGISGAQCLAEMVGENNLITLDMGGTSTDVCLIRDGQPDVTHARTIDGLPIRSTAIDIHTVGAGGSSIAWIDAGGLLRVGPHSAGAKPGPACYGTGGVEPTVTDANVVLGRLHQTHLLGGALPIDADRASQAIDRVVASAKGIDVETAAAAVLVVSNTHIAQAIRFVSVERGLDPGDFTLVAFGGAGPLHAAAVARDLDMDVLVPPGPGVLCAMGVLTKDVRLDLGRTRLIRQSDPDSPQHIRHIFTDLEHQTRTLFSANGLDGDSAVVSRFVDARYVGQNFELHVSAPAGQLDDTAFNAIRRNFDTTHERLYGYRQPDQEVECITFRIQAMLPVRRPDLQPRAVQKRSIPLEPNAHRQVYFEPADGFITCPIYDRATLLPGDVVSGPAIVEQMDATTVVPFDFTARVDNMLNLRLSRSSQYIRAEAPKRLQTS